MKKCKNCNKELTKKQIAKRNVFCCRGCALSYRQLAHDPDLTNMADQHLFYYIMGLIWSDGNLNKEETRITIGLKDLSLIEILYPIFSDTSKRKIYVNQIYRNNKEFYSYVIINNNKNTIEYFKTKGLIPAKSSIIEYPSIPQEYQHDFIRGVFDGDGSVYISSKYKDKNYLGVTIVSGSKNFLIDLQKQLIFNHIECNLLKDSRPENHTYLLKIYKQQSIVKFFNYIYKNSSICLQRKLNIFMNNIV